MLMYSNTFALLFSDATLIMTHVSIEKSKANVLEYISIVKTARSGRIDFNDLTPRARAMISL